MPQLNIRAGHPDFLDLPWDRPLSEWEHPRLVDLPKGISRHTVRFVTYDEGIYAVKELPLRPAQIDYGALRALEPHRTPTVTPVGLVTGRTADPHEEASAALITEYELFSFSYREMLEGPGFGSNRNKLLDAFAGLLVELHLAGCFWGDCSLSNVLYRWDAAAVETIMVDAETASLHPRLSDGQRLEDLEIMRENVAGGMADIAAAAGLDLDQADLTLGDDIADRYHRLWNELTRVETVPAGDEWRITERIRALNDLGFDVDELNLAEEGDHVAVRVRVGSRTFHADRLRELTGIEAGDFQARHILSDLYYYQATSGSRSASGKAVAAIQWRLNRFEPTLAQLRRAAPHLDPVQAYCDLLNHRYLRSAELGRDIGTEAALASWLEEGMPGFDTSDERGP